MNRSAKLVTGLAMIAAFGVAATVVTSASTSSAQPAGKAAAPPITAKVLAAASAAKPISIRTTSAGDVIVASIKVAPGASFGWHYHSAPVVAAVVSGTLTLYDGRDPSCAPQQIPAGHAFTEQKDQIHLARNEGTTPVQVVVTFIGAPHGKPTNVPAKQPSNCLVD